MHGHHPSKLLFSDHWARALVLTCMSNGKWHNSLFPIRKTVFQFLLSSCLLIVLRTHLDLYTHPYIYKDKCIRTWSFLFFTKYSGLRQGTSQSWHKCPFSYQFIYSKGLQKEKETLFSAISFGWKLLLPLEISMVFSLGFKFLLHICDMVDPNKIWTLAGQLYLYMYMCMHTNIYTHNMQCFLIYFKENENVYAIYQFSCSLAKLCFQSSGEFHENI